MSVMDAKVVSCDAKGCAKVVMAVTGSAADARDQVTEAFEWFTSEHGDLCPEHVGERLGG